LSRTRTVNVSSASFCRLASEAFCRASTGSARQFRFEFRSADFVP
jgi:hypothetical protein